MTDSMISYVDFNYYPSDQLNPYPKNRHPFHLNLSAHEHKKQYVSYDKFYYFIHLPKCLQLKILGYLNLKTRLNCSYSSNLLRKLIISSKLWSELDISSCFNSLNKYQLLFLAKLGKMQLKRVNFRGCQQIDGSILWSLGSASPNLTSINLSGCTELTGTNLTSFFYYTHSLTQLNLSGLSCLTPVTLSSIGENCIQLTELNLNWCKIIGNNERYLAKLINSCQFLIKLKINGWKYLSNSVLNAISNLSQLRFLDMQSCSGLTNFRNNNDSQLYFTTLEGLCGGSPLKLWEYLNLNNSNLVSESSFNELIVQCNYLQWLDISNCPQLKSNNLDSIIYHCPWLTHLALEDTPIATDLNLRTICTHLKQLKWVNFGFNTAITDDGIGRVLRNVTNLRYLSIEGCDQVTDRILTQLPKWLTQTHQLECLNVKECKLISCNTVSKFQHGSLYPYTLKYVRLKLLSSFDFIESSNGGNLEAGGFGELGLTSCIIL